MKDSMVFYRSFFEAINDLPDENQLTIYKAIFEFGFNETEPNLIGTDKLVFTLIKPQLEANNRKAKIGKENGHKGAEYGHLGGRPPKEDNPQETHKEPALNPQETPKKPSNVNANVNENANKNVNDNVNKGDKSLHDMCLLFELENPDKYPKAFYEEFVGYWTQIIINGKGKGKQLWKDEKTWDIGRRLATSYKMTWLPNNPVTSKPIRKEGEPMNPQSYYI